MMSSNAAIGSLTVRRPSLCRHSHAPARPPTHRSELYSSRAKLRTDRAYRVRVVCLPVIWNTQSVRGLQRTHTRSDTYE
ncbi:hypothetical protein EVAR_12189_1 [Eumeta japonica]|uniref:Uncharacterized protein n=1 Tax=Eumeta variegata TaxID=151549 RepID=A0A4C1UHU7_EUMVA|nr:hypothetical protein EVAR_12189_1 [Eumeta japonica]